MGGRLSGLGSALYDSKRKEFLGRDGGRWGKLGVFYFFFYLGLAGFFCAMLAIFMALTPRDHPYYYNQDSRMKTRSNPLSPGLGFRPQPDVERNLISVEQNRATNGTDRLVSSMDNYLKVYYWNKQNDKGTKEKFSDGKVFAVRDSQSCSRASSFGYTNGKPCVLVKMNKIIQFIPEALESADDDLKHVSPGCQLRADSIPVVCYGEYPADEDNIGQKVYYSEDNTNRECGSIKKSHFPYIGKKERKDVYQAPYIWVQFTNPKPNVLINVICRAFGSNIDFDKKTGRGLTRFQIFVNNRPTKEEL